MSYEADIYHAIRACTDLWRTISGRFSWDIADSNTEPPYIVAQQVSDSGDTNHNGSRGVSFPTVQFSIWATGKAEASRIADLFAKSMEGRYLPGPSNCALTFDSRTSTYDTDARLFGTILRYRAHITLGDGI
jgi:hypothetical protein